MRTSGSTITEERIAKLTDGTLGASDAPAGAVKTREKCRPP